MKKIKNIFKQGAILPSFVAESIQKHTIKTNIGGHGIFLGQVREDSIGGKKVKALEFTAYEEMALEKASEIREEIIEKSFLRKCSRRRDLFFCIHFCSASQGGNQGL